MSKLSLYQAVIDKQKAIMLCMDEDGVLDMEKFDLIEGNFADRAVASIAVHKSLQIDIVGLEAQRVAINDQYLREIRRHEKNAAKLKQRLLDAMKLTGVMKITSNDGMLSAQLQLERDESVELDEGHEFPADLCIVKAPEPSRSLIKASILKGDPVAGARIVRKDRLTIK